MMISPVVPTGEEAVSGLFTVRPLKDRPEMLLPLESRLPSVRLAAAAETAMPAGVETLLPPLMVTVA